MMRKEVVKQTVRTESSARSENVYFDNYRYLSSKTLLFMLSFERAVPETEESRQRFATIRLLLSTPRLTRFRIARQNYIEKEL